MESIPPTTPEPGFLAQYSLIIALITGIAMILLCIKFSKRKKRPIIKPSEPIHEMPQSPQADHNQTIIIQQPPRQSNGTGTAGFILALISLVLSWVPGVGWIVWFLGLLLSFIGMFRTPRGLAIAGFLISIIDLIILLVFVGALAAFFAFL